MSDEQLTNTSRISSVDSLSDSKIDKLLFAIAAIAILLIQPYFIWGNLLVVLRILHFFGNAIIIYIIIKYYDYNFYSKDIVLFFIIIALYTMLAGTELQAITYIPLLTMLYLIIKPIQQLRIFNYFTSILAVVFAFGLVSYFISLLGWNIEIGKAISPNISKQPYSVFWGHIEEADLPIYRFSSIFDESGVVGTLCGLILSGIGISTKNIKSIVFLLTGLISLSLAFYIILIFILLFSLNVKKVILISSLIFAVAISSGPLFDELISSRLNFENGKLSGDNRTSIDFDAYVDSFIAKGGNDLIFGKGDRYASSIDEVEGVSTYKTILIDFGLVGSALFVLFYMYSVYNIFNSKRGWLLAFIFIISSYQRPDLINFFTLLMFIGGLRYLKNESTIQLSIAE